MLKLVSLNAKKIVNHRQKQQISLVMGNYYKYKKFRPSIQLYHAGLKIKTQLNLTQPAETYPMNTFCNMNNVFNVEEDLYFSPAIIDVSKIILLITGKTFLSILGTDAITTRIFDSS